MFILEVKVELLGKSQQHDLLRSFLEEKCPSSSMKQNLHCIKLGSCVKQSASHLTPITTKKKVDMYKQIIIEECIHMLHHYDWTRLKQAFWIKYLYPRCGILANSNKFNKNHILVNFGR